MDAVPEPAAKKPKAQRPRLTRRARVEGWLAALFGAAMITLAMPSIGLALPMLVALVPALVVSRQRTWRQRLHLGWLTGFLAHVALFRWIPFTLTEMTPLPLPVGWAAWLLYAAWHGLALGLFITLAEPVRRLVDRHAPAAASVAVALLYVAVEGFFPALFPWSLGHALWQVGPAAALQALGGVPLLALFVMLVQVVIADAWTRRPRPARVGAVVALGLLAAGLGWYLHVDGLTPTRTLRVAVVQPNYTLAEKKKANLQQRKRLLDRFERLVRGLPRDRYDLVVASEGAFPMYWRVDAEALPESQALPVVATRRALAAVREGPHAEAIVGGLRQGEHDATHNAAVHIDAEGHVVGHYDKRVLVPFSEYIPLSDIFPGLKNAVSGIGHFTPGTAPCRFVAAGVPTACGICYETMFEDETREAAGDDARLLVNLTIDTWFGPDVAPEMHLMTHASRAVELGLPLVRGALTGISALVLPTGRVAAELPLDTEGVLSLEVPLSDVTTPYRVVGPVLPWLAAAVSVLLLGLALRRRRELFEASDVLPSRKACSSSSDHGSISTPTTTESSPPSPPSPSAPATPAGEGRTPDA